LIVVDGSVLVTIFVSEPEAESFEIFIAKDDDPV
jgi:uncharacterized protein with PIN domain